MMVFSCPVFAVVATVMQEASWMQHGKMEA